MANDDGKKKAKEIEDNAAVAKAKLAADAKLDLGKDRAAPLDGTIQVDHQTYQPPEAGQIDRNVNIRDEKPQLSTDEVIAAQRSADRALDRRGRIEEQRQRHDENMAKLSEANKEGHERNMAKVEASGKLAADVQEYTGPATGKENNRNTPAIDPATGAKIWR